MRRYVYTISFLRGYRYTVCIQAFEMVNKTDEISSRSTKGVNAVSLREIFESTFDLSEMIAYERATLGLACLSEQKKK